MWFGGFFLLASVTSQIRERFVSGRKRRRVSPTTVKSESCTHSRQRHFDEQRRENIRTLRRRVEHTTDITLQMHIICIIIRSLFHAIVKAAMLPAWLTKHRDPWLSVALNCGKLKSKFTLIDSTLSSLSQVCVNLFGCIVNAISMDALAFNLY